MRDDTHHKADVPQTTTVVGVFPSPRHLHWLAKLHFINKSNITCTS